MNPKDRETLADILHTPGMLESVNTTMLRSWLEEYPWFQGLHLLMLKKMHTGSVHSFTDQLARSAWFVPDRSILWHLLHTPAPAQPQSQIPPVSEPPPPQPQPQPQPQSVPQPQATPKEDPKADLISRFIQAEPRIVPREGPFESAVELAEKSNIPVFDLVTETLANVYLQQGNRGKALKILEKLSLSMPEKSSYFAARIAEIKSSPNSV